MSTGRIGVAISTTGDEHRLSLLIDSVQGWDQALPDGSVLFVTVDGDETAVERVATAVFGTGDIYRVGQPRSTDPRDWLTREGRLGVAVNKNTGIELLMDAGVEHLFLSDDDTYPYGAKALTEQMTAPHTMVCWGKHRFGRVSANGRYAYWSWPRGVALYMHRSVVEIVGGMDERFGPGGHEHVEYSNRIHNADLTPQPYVSPAYQAQDNGFGARRLWFAADMRQPGEPLGNHRLRRRNLTTVRREDGDWDHINDIMFAREGSREFVAFSAHENGRASATLCSSMPSRGAGGEK